MPTKKPRVMVVLEPEAHAVLVGMARLGGQSVGKVLAQLANPALPVLAKLVEAGERYQSFQAEVREKVGVIHHGVESDLVRVLAAIEREMDEVSRASGVPVPPAVGERRAAPGPVKRGPVRASAAVGGLGPSVVAEGAGGPNLPAPAPLDPRARRAAAASGAGAVRGVSGRADPRIVTRGSQGARGQ